MKVMADSDKYFIDQTVELEKTRMEQQMKMERQRLKAEIVAREANIRFPREIMVDADANATAFTSSTTTTPL